MTHIYLIQENNRASAYGVGTYVRQLLDVLQKMSVSVTVVTLFTKNEEAVTVENKDGVRLIGINKPEVLMKNDTKIGYYYENVFYILSLYINPEENNIFHFNHLQGKELIRLLKQQFLCKIAMTVHCMEWSFQLLGDISKLKSLLVKTENIQEQRIVEIFMEEKLILSYADEIIAIAEHSYNCLRELYDVPVIKIHHISNGLKDYLKETHVVNKNNLRDKYHFKAEDKILIFAGRMDRVKGLNYLIEAFKKSVESIGDIYLIIAGEGDFCKYMNISFPVWNKITYTGLVDRILLYELYQIADIGIVPSLHEEFGYVAIEMMMNNLPVIANRSTGLIETVENEHNGRLVTLSQDMEISSLSLFNVINELINDKEKLAEFAVNGRARYKQRYSLEIFEKKMVCFYENMAKA